MTLYILFIFFSLSVSHLSASLSLCLSVSLCVSLISPFPSLSEDPHLSFSSSTLHSGRAYSAAPPS